jgi:hypothetical protein
VLRSSRDCVAACRVLVRESENAIVKTQKTVHETAARIALSDKVIENFGKVIENLGTLRGHSP